MFVPVREALHFALLRGGLTAQNTAVMSAARVLGRRRPLSRVPPEHNGLFTQGGNTCEAVPSTVSDFARSSGPLPDSC